MKGPSHFGFDRRGFLKTLGFCATAFALTSCRSGVPDQASHSLPASQEALINVKTIYLGDFGNAEGAALVREKLRIRLMKSGRFEVVETPDRADAILAGAAGVDKSISEGETRYKGSGLLRLVDTKTQKTLWAHEYQRGLIFAGSVSSRVADQMADELLKAAGSSN
jgi:hypothetical protein